MKCRDIGQRYFVCFYLFSYIDRRCVNRNLRGNFVENFHNNEKSIMNDTIWQRFSMKQNLLNLQFKMSYWQFCFGNPQLTRKTRYLLEKMQIRKRINQTKSEYSDQYLHLKIRPKINIGQSLCIPKLSFISTIFYLTLFEWKFIYMKSIESVIVKPNFVEPFQEVNLLMDFYCYCKHFHSTYLNEEHNDVGWPK